MFKKINKKNVTILTLITILFVLGIFLLFKNFLSYSILENKFSDYFGLKIELIKPKSNLSLNLNLTTKAEYINIYDLNKKNLYATIENPIISFKPLNLIFNKLNIRALNAQHVKVNLKRDEKGNTNLINSILQNDLSFLKDRQINLTKLNSKIDKIELIFDDNYKIKNKTILKLDNSEIKISKKHKSLFIKQAGTIETNINSQKQLANINLNINSRYPINKLNSNNLEANIDLNNLNLFIFNDLAKKYISKEITALLGTVDLSIKTKNDTENIKQNLNIKIKNPTIKQENKTINPYKTITITTPFSIDKNSIKFDDLNIRSTELNISSKGEIQKPFSKKPIFDFKTSIKETELNNFLYFLPDNLIFYRPQGIPTLKKADFHGKINGDITTKLLPLDINGRLKISNVYIPNYPKTFRENDVNVLFLKDKVKIYTRVYTPDNEYVLVDGISNLDDSLYGKYSIKSTKNIDLSFAQKYLVPIQQIIGFNIGPVPIMEISGYGNIDIKTQGTLNDGQIFGEFNAFNATAKIKGLNAQLTNGNCKLLFNNRDIEFKEIKGKLNEADFLLTGLGNTKGEINLNTEIKNARTHEILKIFNDSLISKPYSKLTKNIAATSGKIQANINLKGVIKNYEDENFLTTLTPDGTIIFQDNKIILNNKLSAKNISGMVNFGKEQNGNIDFKINGTNFKTQFSSKSSLDKIAKGETFEIKNELFSNQLSFKDLIKEIKNGAFIEPHQKHLLNNLENIDFYTKLHLKSNGYITLDEINPEKLNHSGYIIGLNSQKNPAVNFNSGIIKINNSKLIFEDFCANISQGKIKIKGHIDNFLSNKPFGNLAIDLKNIDLTSFSNITPKLNLSSSKINSGQIVFKNNDLKFNSISLDYETMPLFLNAQIKDLFNSRFLSCDYSTILNEQTTDNIINPYLTYPLKIKGEIPIKGTFKGNIQKYIVDFIATLPKESDIYFSGANIGDINHKREIQGKLEVNQNIATIHNFKLIKFIANQNKKTNPITTLKANGQIKEKDSELFYENLKISTNSPINVRILNLLFKKSLLKQGNFECNLNLNGNSKTPDINGKISLQDLDIPLYNTKINNININIIDKYIDALILAKNNQSDLKVNLKAQNKLEAPYILNNISITSSNLDIQDILDILTVPTQKNDINFKEEISLKPEDIIIKNGIFEFKDVKYQNQSAQNLKGNFDYKDNIFNLKNSTIDIAQGKIIANGNYNLKNTGLNLDAKMENCDSNILSEDFLHLKDQIFGKMNGSIKLTANNLNTIQGIKSLKSDVIFAIDNGKMPKLGSLEYLLRAGNLVKNGLLGLSLNNIIQVLTPYKTGDFEKISGNLTIGDGKIQDLEILSQGKNLSMYLEGTYNLLESYADIKIYGKLSQNISNALGAIGNASINQFINTLTSKKDDKNKDIELQEKLNKIPSIEIENPAPRFFKAKVLGDINKDNYIKSFNWE